MFPRLESYRDSRRLQKLRGWSDGTSEQVFTGAARARRAHGGGVQGEHESEWAAIRSIAEKIGCTSETLRKWVRQAQRDAGRRPGAKSDELERENRELRRANEILRKASAFSAQAELDRGPK